MAKRMTRNLYSPARREREHNELLSRTAAHAEEMRQNKGQQWRTLYYSTLVLVVLALAFQQKVNLGLLYLPTKVAAILTIIGVAAVSTIHLLALKYEIDLNRAAAYSMEDELNRLTGVSGRLDELHKSRYEEIVAKSPAFLRWLPKRLVDRNKQLGLYNGIFTGTFVAIVWLAAIGAILLVYFDT